MPRAFAALLAVLAAAGCAALPGNASRTDPLFARIEPGWTEAQVGALIGRPDETMPFPLSGHHSWDYYYTDTWGYFALFSVTFDARGTALSKFSRRLNDGSNQQ